MVTKINMNSEARRENGRSNVKETIVVDVKEGSTLQLALGTSPVGQPITIPQGVTSVTVIVRDTAGFEEAKARRAERRTARGQARRRRQGLEDV
jgi:hypothetical protein